MGGEDRPFITPGSFIRSGAPRAHIKPSYQSLLSLQDLSRRGDRMTEYIIPWPWVRVPPAPPRNSS